MKQSYFLLLLGTLAFCTANAQLMQASIGTGSAANRYKIYLKADATQTPSNISTLQFNIAVSDATTPKPTMTVFSSSLTGVSTSAWTVSEATEGGYYNYQLTNSLSTIASNFTANTEVEALEVEFTGGPGSLNAGLVTLPDGGASGISLFLCTGSYNSDGRAVPGLYYARTGTVVNNQNSYDLVTPAPGVATSTAFLSSGGTQITDMFRTIQSGQWGSTSTWESSSDGITWIPATLTPTDASGRVDIRNGHSVTVAAAVTIDETFVAPQGELIVNDALTVMNQGLTFESDANSTGRIGTSLGTLTGNVNVDRFIPARRAWRLITSPVDATETINAAWQEGAGGTASSDPKPGYGTHITGGSVANGFDQSPLNNPSMKVFDQATNNFVGIASTNVALNSQPGYFIFVRGDRSTNLNMGSSAPTTTTTLTSTGAARTGLQSVPVNTTGFTLIGNPYVSPIDFAATTKTNVADRFFVWDPKRATVGAYVLFEGSSGYVPLNTGGSYAGANSTVQTGQAFLVEATGSGASLSINEVDKSATQMNVFRNSDADDQKLQVNLEFLDARNNAVIADATAVRFNSSYKAAVTGEDAGKPDNIDENLAIESGNRLLTVERRPLSSDETLQLKIFNMKARDYQFEIEPTHFNALGLTAFLEDAYLNTSTPISLTSTTLVRFSVTSDAASANAYRFKVVFKQRSVAVATAEDGVSVYPNPAKSGFTVKMANLNTTNKIRLALTSKSGQTVAVREVSSQQAANYYFTLPSVSAGTYTLNVYNGNELVESKQLIIKQ